MSRPRRPYSVLLPVGFSVPPLLPKTRCALTAPFHPYLPTPKAMEGGLLSVALSLGLTPPEVIRHRVSMEPGLSSPPDTQILAERPSGLLTQLHKGLGGSGVKLPAGAHA